MKIKHFFLLVFSVINFHLVNAQDINDIKGEYVVQEANEVKAGQRIGYPFRGVSMTYQVTPIDANTAKVVQTIYERGRMKSNQTFNIKVEPKAGRVEWSEIWESGELYTDGYFAGNQLVLNMRERNTN